MVISAELHDLARDMCDLRELIDADYSKKERIECPDGGGGEFRSVKPDLIDETEADAARLGGAVVVSHETEGFLKATAEIIDVDVA